MNSETTTNALEHWPNVVPAASSSHRSSAFPTFPSLLISFSHWFGETEYLSVSPLIFSVMSDAFLGPVLLCMCDRARTFSYTIDWLRKLLRKSCARVLNAVNGVSASSRHSIRFYSFFFFCSPCRRHDFVFCIPVKRFLSNLFAVRTKRYFLFSFFGVFGCVRFVVGIDALSSRNTHAQ